MNQDTKKELIKAAIKEYKQEEQKNQKKKVYHNTELLMKNYKELRQHSENAVYKASQVFISNEEEPIREKILSNPEYDETDHYTIGEEELYINSILKSKVRTAVMLQHMDMALGILKDSAVQNSFDNKYNAFIDFYMQNLQYNELAAKYNCAEMTVRRWKNEMIDKLSILLFGAEALILGA